MIPLPRCALFLARLSLMPERPKAAFVHCRRGGARGGREVAVTLSDPFCVRAPRASFRQLRDRSIQCDIVFAENIDELFDPDSADQLLDAGD